MTTPRPDEPREPVAGQIAEKDISLTFAKGMAARRASRVGTACGRRGARP